MAVENLITEHLDIWTSAIKTKSAAGRGSSKKMELVGVKKLRELILELAVRGKLVPQNPNDEPASELLKKIEAEKVRLVKEGKIKKQKPLPPISDDEKPFGLPNSWECERIGTFGIVGTGSTPSRSNPDYWEPPEFNWVSSGETSGFFVNATKEKVSALAIKETNVSLYPAGTLIVAMYGQGKTRGQITELLCKAGTNQACAAIQLVNEAKHHKNYVKLYFRKAYIELRSYAAGGAQPNLNVGKISNTVMALPPLAEQHRIVAKVDELMVLCDQLEAQTEANIDAHKTLVEVLLATLTDAKDVDELNDNWQTISQYFDVLFTTQASIDQLKQTILQLAVMGKLVKQDPNDEPASKLLERIATEKQQLIKDGKIKKQKSLPPITNEEKPFDLPNSWECERIGTFGIVGTGSTPSRSNPDYWAPPEFNWVSSGETSDFFVSTTKEKVTALAIKETNVSLYPAGTLIVAMYGQGKTRGQITELLCEAGTNQACAAIRLVNATKHHKNYVKLYFRKAYAELRSHAAGGAQPNLNVGKIANTVLALPPLAEQHRIVAKVDELMALCDSLEVGLSEAQTTQLHLTDVIVEQAS
jgi:type I restriction enzyme S subunit